MGYLSTGATHIGDIRALAGRIAPGSIQALVTSPPYWQLRSYLPSDHADKAREMGQEATPDAYVASLVDVFIAMRSAMRADGTIWVNIGDAYAREGGGIRKSLLMLPARFALAMMAAGFILRSKITLIKIAPIPESVKDRPTTATEELFLFSMQNTYYYDRDAVAEALAPESLARLAAPESGWLRDGAGVRNARNYLLLGDEDAPSPPASAAIIYGEETNGIDHFAPFPTTVPRFALRAGTSEYGACLACGAPWHRLVERALHGVNEKRPDIGMPRRRGKGLSRACAGFPVVRTIGWGPTCACGIAEVRPCVALDPFMGTGTTAVVATEMRRDWLGIDLDPRAARWTEDRVYGRPIGMLLEV